MHSAFRTALPALLIAAFGLPAAQAQSASSQDLAPVNTVQMLKDLHELAEKRSGQFKTFTTKAMQDAASAASNPARAAELYEEAVRVTQFQGLSRDTAQFRDWKNNDGEALKAREVQGALHLYFNWLNLTLQRAAGTPAHDLLPAVLSHAREVLADQAAMDLFDENLKREKEALKETPGAPKRMVTAHDKEKRKDDDAVKRLHDQLVTGGLANSVYAQWMRLGDTVSTIAPAPRRGGRNQPGEAPKETGWVGSPGDSDGMYQTIILPELRTLHDSRALEYWEAKLRREADQVSRSKLAFDIDKFNLQRRPQLLWSRAQEFAQIGQKNRAATEMFTLIKTFPASPETANWVAELEGLLAPPAPGGVAPPPLPGTP